MRRTLTISLSTLIPILVPAILVVNCIRVLANDWYIHFEYAKPDFPPDAYGFTPEQRTELALTGLHSVLPQDGAGIDLLRRERQPNGDPAFNERELGHMQDVRSLIGQVYPLHLIALAAIAVLALGLGRSAQMKRVVPRALQAGAILTLLIAAGLIAYILINFQTFFTQFHQLFFEGDTWQFQFTDTLIRLYPVRFWSDAATYIGVGTVAQALALLVAARMWSRRSGDADSLG